MVHLTLLGEILTIRSYLWTGQLDSAESLLRQLDPPGNLINELDAWRWWWQTQQRPDLSSHANQMLKRLK